MVCGVWRVAPRGIFALLALPGWFASLVFFFRPLSGWRRACHPVARPVAIVQPPQAAPAEKPVQASGKGKAAKAAPAPAAAEAAVDDNPEAARSDVTAGAGSADAAAPAAAEDRGAHLKELRTKLETVR